MNTKVITDIQSLEIINEFNVPSQTLYWMEQNIIKYRCHISLKKK